MLGERITIDVGDPKTDPLYDPDPQFAGKENSRIMARQVLLELARLYENQEMAEAMYMARYALTLLINDKERISCYMILGGDLLSEDFAEHAQKASDLARTLGLNAEMLAEAHNLAAFTAYETRRRVALAQTEDGQDELANIRAAREAREAELLQKRRTHAQTEGFIIQTRNFRTGEWQAHRHRFTADGVPIVEPVEAIIP